MPTVIWSNGKVDQAETWEQLETLIRLDQWSGMDPEEFREEMAKRAYRWSGLRIDRGLTAQDFFAELAAAYLIEIVNDYGKES